MDNNLSNIVLETLNKAINEYIKQIERELNKASKVKDLKDKSKVKQDAAKMKKELIQARVQIFNSYTSITKSVFKSVFDNYYGPLYDEESLFSSLKFLQLGNGAPYLTYNIDEFKFTPYKEVREKEVFNFNQVSQNTAKRFSEEDWYDTGLMENFFQDDEESDYVVNNEVNEDEQEQDLASLSIDFSNFQKSNQNISANIFPSVVDVYRVAKERANQEFNKQYISLIKPQLLKKYPNIKL